MGRWYEKIRTHGRGTTDADDGQLIGEVNHEAGNLVHKMYYWTNLLEDGVNGSDAEEAVDRLRDSLGELHRLVNRSMELVRPVEARPLQISTQDLFETILVRLSVRDAALVTDVSPSGFDAQLADLEVAIDPVHLDRAIGMLSEALTSCGAVHPEVEAFSAVAVLPGLPGETPDFGERPIPVAMLVHCRAAVVADGIDERSDSVHAAVGIALAKKLLAACDWQVQFEVRGGVRDLHLVVPIGASRMESEVGVDT